MSFSGMRGPRAAFIRHDRGGTLITHLPGAGCSPGPAAGYQIAQEGLLPACQVTRQGIEP
jgi:hypothetical protein